MSTFCGYKLKITQFTHHTHTPFKFGFDVGLSGGSLRVLASHIHSPSVVPYSNTAAGEENRAAVSLWLGSLCLGPADRKIVCKVWERIFNSFSSAEGGQIIWRLKGNRKILSILKVDGGLRKS